MMNNKREVIICTFANASYIQHACVMLKSLTSVWNVRRAYTVFFFYSDCTAEVLNKVREEFLYERNFNINFIECDTYKKYSSRLKLNHYSMSIYAKVFIYDLLPENVKKVLFFDSDIVLLSDPGELFDKIGRAHV
jgi:lipopolysaccharide biosynthesis glycosyltransferase